MRVALRRVSAEIRGRRAYGISAWRECKRLERLPRYSSGISTLLGFESGYTHPQSLAGLYRQIFVEGSYRFRSFGPAPLILDCGANIGVSVAWFKQTWPQSRITAFEADPVIAEVLRRNVAAAGFEHVTVVPKAVWTGDEALSFVSEGGDAGRLGAGTTQVQGTRLRDWLTEPIDLLKMDIEGAEVEVLADCALSLGNVANVILEFHSLVDRPQRLGATLELLERAGFRVWIRDEWIPIQPLLDREQQAGMDMRLNIFARR